MRNHITRILIIFLVASQVSVAQSAYFWEHFYAPVYGQFNFGNYLANKGPEEVILIDKSTFDITRIPFPDTMRLFNPHNSTFYDTANAQWSNCTPSLYNGPYQTLLLKTCYFSNDGYLFDGMDWTPITDFHGISLGSISFLPYTGGSQYFTASGKLYKYDGSSLTFFDSTNSPINSADPYYNISCNYLDDVFLSYQNAIAVFHNGSWMSYDTAFFHIPYFTQSFCVSPTGNFTFSNPSDTSLKTFDISSGTWSTLSIPASYIHSPVNGINFRTISYDENGVLWLMGDKIFFSYDGSLFHDYFTHLPATYTAPNSTPAIFVLSALPDSNLLLSSNGYSLFNTGTFSFTGIANDPHAVLTNNYMLPSLKATNGDLWFGSYSGYGDNLVRYRNGTWSTPALSIHNINNGVNTIVQDTGNAIVFGVSGLTSPGPIQLTDTNFVFINDSAQTYYHSVDAIAIDQNHHYWFGGPGAGVPQGLTEFYNGTITEHPNFNTSNHVNAVEIDSLNTKWVSFTSCDGVYSFDGTTWTQYNVANSLLPNDTIINIVREPQSNALWFCTTNGFAKYHNGNWTLTNTSNAPLPGNHAEFVYWDQNGYQWFGTQNGLASLFNNTWTVYTPANSPLHNSDIESMIVDDQCSLWICTEAGLTHAISNCGLARGAFITGTVQQYNTAPAQKALVRIYKLNGAGNDIRQTDNLFTDNTGHFTYFTPDTSGTYYFRAEAGSTSFPGQLSAYEDSAIVIQQATPVQFSTSGNYTVNMRMAAAHPVSGSLNLYGKISSITERIGSVMLVLEQNGLPVATVNTNFDGTFRFTDLPVGNYEVWVDKVGLDNALAPFITLDSASNSTVYYFILHPNRLEMTTTGLPGPNLSAGVSIYPNPCRDNLIIHLDPGIRENGILKIFDVIGTLIDTKVLLSTDEQIDVRGLPSGIYFLKLEMKEGTVTRKIVKI